MKKITLCLLIGSVSALVSAQSPPRDFTPVYRDSLLLVVDQPADDTADLNALFQLARELIWTEKAKADTLVREMIYRSRDRNNRFWEGLAYNAMGRLKETSGEVDSALVYNQRALDIFAEGTEKRWRQWHVNTLLNRGVYYYMRSDHEEAIKHYREAYGLVTSDQPETLSKILNNLGVAYRRIEKLREAGEVYRESIELKRAASDSVGLAASLHNLGILELEERNSEEAMQLFRESRLIYQELGDTAEANTIDVSIGQAYYNSGRPREAKKIWLEAINKPNLKLNLNSISYLFLGLADVHYMDGEYAESREYAEDGLAYAERTGRPRLITDYKKILGLLHRESGEYEVAAEYLGAYSLAMDTLVETERLRYEQEMGERFASERREAEIDRQALLIRQQRQQNLLWIASALLLGMLALGLFLVFRYRLRAKEGEALLREAEKKREIESIRREAEVENLRSVLVGQEAERQRVARDLHDGLGGLLATVKARMPANNGNGGGEAEKMLDRACTEVRRIAHNMSPHSLSLSGLTGALEDVVAQLRLQGIDCDYEIVGQPDLRLEEEKQLMVLRIIQELSHNITKHARAEKAFIQLLDQPHQLLLTVEDDGVGFDPEAVPGSGLGLTSIDGRVNYLNGTVLYDSGPGRGTTVTITLPL